MLGIYGPSVGLSRSCDLSEAAAHMFSGRGPGVSHGHTPTWKQSVRQSKSPKPCLSIGHLLLCRSRKGRTAFRLVLLLLLVTSGGFADVNSKIHNRDTKTRKTKLPALHKFVRTLIFQEVAVILTASYFLFFLFVI